MLSNTSNVRPFGLLRLDLWIIWKGIVILKGAVTRQTPER